MSSLAGGLLDLTMTTTISFPHTSSKSKILLSNHLKHVTVLEWLEMDVHCSFSFKYKASFLYLGELCFIDRICASCAFKP